MNTTLFKQNPPKKRQQFYFVNDPAILDRTFLKNGLIKKDVDCTIRYAAAMQLLNKTQYI